MALRSGVNHNNTSEGSRYDRLDKPDGWYFVEQRGEVPRNMEEAVEFHIDSMRKDGDPIPEPTTGVAYAEVA